MSVIEVRGLTKRYKSVQVLDGLDLTVNEGEVYGLLGPNGAGKSTLVHLLLGFLYPNGGRIQVLGKSPGAARKLIGYLPERVRYHTNFTAREYLGDLGTLSNIHGKRLSARRSFVLDQVGLSTVADRRLGAYSKGMLQRLGIAQALIHEPALLIIDEPTSGLDPAGQREMIDLVAELRRQGHTIFMCTHQIAEAETLCDRVGILGGRRLVAEANLAELKIAGGVALSVKDRAVPELTVSRLFNLGAQVKIFGNEIRVTNDEALQRQVLRILLDDEITITEIKPLGGGLEDMYLKVVRGRGLEALPENLGESSKVQIGAKDNR